jgi:hypothetical protein
MHFSSEYVQQLFGHSVERTWEVPLATIYTQQLLDTTVPVILYEWIEVDDNVACILLFGWRTHVCMHGHGDLGSKLYYLLEGGLVYYT